LYLKTKFGKRRKRGEEGGGRGMILKRESSSWVPGDCQKETISEAFAILWDFDRRDRRAREKLSYFLDMGGGRDGTKTNEKKQIFSNASGGRT